MNHKVEIIDGTWAKVFINESYYFIVCPTESYMLGKAATIIEWLSPSMIDIFHVDEQGQSLDTKDNFAWLIDLTMEHGLRFPAMED